MTIQNDTLPPPPIFSFVSSASFDQSCASSRKNTFFKNGQRIVFSCGHEKQPCQISFSNSFFTTAQKVEAEKLRFSLKPARIYICSFYLVLCLSCLTRRGGEVEKEAPCIRRTYGYRRAAPRPKIPGYPDPALKIPGYPAGIPATGIPVCRVGKCQHHSRVLSKRVLG